MRVGILGSGLMGGKLGTIFARAGHQVVFCYACSGQKFKKRARKAKGKVQAGTARETASTNPSRPSATSLCLQKRTYSNADPSAPPNLPKSAVARTAWGCISTANSLLPAHP
jgi:3-hydroxyacyl-CoA dehydrogenase